MGKLVIILSGMLLSLYASTAFAGHDCHAAEVAAVAAPAAGDDVKAIAECRYCGMDRGKFGYSRVLIEYDDGSTVGTCSIRCAAVDLVNNLDKAPEAIKVGDYGTRQLIDAEKAFWVMGGAKQGVMTRQAKWAFGNKEDADRFIKENGGKLANFDEMMKATYDDLYQDTKMIREKRKMMRIKMEKK